MATTETIRRLTIQAREEGVDAVTAALGKLSDAQGQAATATQSSGRAALSAERGLRQLEQRYDDSARAAAVMEKAVRTLTAAEQQGIVTSQRSAEILDLVRAKHLAVGAAAVGVGRSVGTSTGQIVGMQYQLNDIAVSLASGQSPFMVLMQQGMQLSQMFGPGATLSTFATALGAGVASMLNPINLAVVGLAAAAGGATLLYDVFKDEAPTLDALLQRHADLIRDLKDAYGDAADGLDEYGRASNTVLGVQNSASIAELETRLRAVSLEALTGLGARSRGRFSSSSPFAVFEEQILNATEAARVGLPAFTALAEEVAKLAQASPADAALAKLATELFDATREAKGLEQAILAARRAASLGEGDTRGEAVRDALGSRADRLEAGRIGLERAGEGVPLPLAKPNLLGFDPNAAATKAGEDSAKRAAGVVASLRFEAEQLGRTNLEQRVYNELKAAGVAADSAMGAQIRALVVDIDAQKRATAEMVDSLDFARDASGGFLSDMVDGARAGADAWDTLGRAIDGVLSKILDRGEDAFIDGLLGKSGTTDPGLLGGMFGLGRPPAVSVGMPTPGSPDAYAYGLPAETAAVSAGGGSPLPPSVENYRAIVERYSAQHGVDPNLALAVMNAESRGDPTARSPVGATGLMQLMPGTARDLGVNPHDPEQNIAGGVDYLGQMGRRYGGDTTKTLAAYNWGPGRVDNWSGDMAALPGETQDYIARVNAFMPKVDEASRSVATLGQAATGATGSVGQFGQGLSTAAQAIATPGATTTPSAGGGLFGGLGGLFGGAPLSDPGGLIAMGAYDRGGYTGAGGKHEIAGAVHRGEYVFDAGSTSRIGVANLERMRGYANGGHVVSNDDIPALLRNGGGGGDAIAARGGGSTVQIIDQRRGGEQIEREETSGPGGEKILRFIVRDEIKKAARPKGMIGREMDARGATRRPTMRT